MCVRVCMRVCARVHALVTMLAASFISKQKPRHRRLIYGVFFVFNSWILTKKEMNFAPLNNCGLLLSTENTSSS